MLALAEITIGIGVLSLLIEITNYLQGDGVGANRRIIFRFESAFILLAAIYAEAGLALNGVVDSLTGIRLFLIGGISIILILVSSKSFDVGGEEGEREFYSLFLLSLMGTLYILKTTDTLSLYLAIELQTLGFYILAAYSRNSEVSTEAALKYFVLGSLSSGLLLFGLSAIYLSTGLTDLNDLFLFFSSPLTGSSSLHLGEEMQIGTIGLIFFLAALLFKIGLAPFHFWVPDVYEGAPTLVTAIFSTLPKIPLFILLLKIMFIASSSVLPLLFKPIFAFVALSSLILGSFGAILQQRLKRLLAFSTIAHMGYVAIALTSEWTTSTITTVYFYLLIYVTMSITIFTAILSLYHQNTFIDKKQTPIVFISDLQQLIFKNIPIALAITLCVFSMAGIPPLPGFFSKFYLFLWLFSSSSVSLLLVTVSLFLAGVSAIYYLFLIHTMFFSSSSPRTVLLASVPKENAFFISFFSFVLVLYSLSPSTLYSFCQLCATSFFV